MILALILGATMGAQPVPDAGPGPRERFVICPGHRRCPSRPSRQEAERILGAVSGSVLGRIGRPDVMMFARPATGGSIPGNMLRFERGEATLNAEAREFLDGIAERMLARGDSEALLEGHADPAGSDAANLALAGRRAGAAADYLAGRGVPRDRILAISWGEAGHDSLGEPRSVVVTLRRREPPPAP